MLRHTSKYKQIMFGILIMLGISLSLGTGILYGAEQYQKKLTPKLNELLTDEMLSIKQAVTHIMNGIVVGDHSIVENMATQINDSFILKQQLTEKDKADLMAVAPKRFLEMDGKFHELSGKLADAAVSKDYDLQRFYFGKLIESCQTCHSEYVTDKFPSFSGAAPSGHVH